MKTIKRYALSIVTLCLVSLGADAATRYVEPWGTDNASCGNKTEPCRTIQHTIDQRSSARTRILVGPGIYRENIHIGENAAGASLRGLRLESTHGRHATVVEALEPDEHVLWVSAEAVRIGRRAHGFTVQGATESGAAGIIAWETPGLRIEGNLVRANLISVSLSGKGILVRDNIIEDNATGLLCGQCERARIENNEINGNAEHGIFAGDIQTGMVFRGNRIADNHGNGIGMGPDMTGLVFIGNAIEGSGLAGVHLRGADRLKLQKNVVSGSVSTGLYIENQFAPGSATIQDNLVFNNRSIGSVIENAENQVLERNGFVQNSTYGLHVNAGNGMRRFQRNMTYANGSGCGLWTAVGIEFRHHFFGSAEGPDTGFDGDGIDALCGNLVTEGVHAARPTLPRATGAAL